MSLTRADLERNRIRQELALTPLGQHLLSDAELEESLWQILDARNVDEDCWVFGYGSLVWNPLFPFEEKRVVTTHGYHRSFCLWSRVNRGTPDSPGLVLGLDRGGRCTGVAYRIPARLAEDELRLLWRREMLLGSYAPKWVHVTHGKRSFRALAFVVNRDRSGYAGRLAAEAIVDRLVHAKGTIGTGLDYLRQTIDGLAALGIRDPNLMHPDAPVRARGGEDGPHRSRADLQR